MSLKKESESKRVCAHVLMRKEGPWERSGRLHCVVYYSILFVVNKVCGVYVCVHRIISCEFYIRG